MKKDRTDYELTVDLLVALLMLDFIDVDTYNNMKYILEVRYYVRYK